jgi:hypothetical protein
MKIRIPIAIFLIAINPIGTGAWGQNVYKCGNTYSQQPCPGGTLVDAADTRTSEQKKAADQASERHAKAADTLEQARLKKEKTEQQALTASKKPTVAPSTTASQPRDSAGPKKTAKKSKAKAEGDFKAQVPADQPVKKKKPAPKTAAAAKDDSKP